MLATAFNNIQFVLADSQNSVLIVVDQNDLGNRSTVSRFTLKTNFTNRDRPRIQIDSQSQVKHYSGEAISGLCLNARDKILFLAVPSKKYIIRNEFNDEAQDRAGNKAGTQQKIFEDIFETQWINGIACNDYNNQLYWFNSVDQQSVSNSNLYHANERGKGSAALLVTGVDTPSDIIKDRYDDKLYFDTKG